MDDHEIIRRAQAGDKHAFGTLFDLYYPTVYHYLNERMGGAPEAEDLCQEVFLTVLSAIDEYPAGGMLRFEDWLLRVARRLAHEYQQRRQAERRPAHPRRSRPGGTHRLNPQALALLPDLQRRIVSYRFQSGLSARQTAAVLGVETAFVRRAERAALETWIAHAPPCEDDAGPFSFDD
jgi:RNA polymerase sigma-70 factor (ECF subfamily)